ncbi:MAG: PLAT/LH2 domain-containing protein [Bacillota bacterium]
MDVTVTTSKDWWSGTNDNIYLGMKYTDGTKSEFLLDTDWVDDFEPGDKRTYKVFSMKKQSEVTEVYLRKSGIDHWKVQALKLTTGGEVKLDKTINQWIKTSSDSWKTSVSW